MKKITFGFTCLAIFCLPVILSCNAASPLNSTNSRQDYLEEAQKCLGNNDFDCAVAQYQKLDAGDEKNEKLCVVYLSKAGFDLKALIEVITKSDASMLGALAQYFIPWTQAKSDALDMAATNCTTFANSGSAASLNLLTASLLSHCAIRVAKTDQFLGSSDSDTACTTAGNRDGKITQADIAPTASGAATSPAMCAADATACSADIATLSAKDLLSAGLSSLQKALAAVPSELKSANSSAATSRAGLYKTVPAN